MHKFPEPKKPNFGYPAIQPSSPSSLSEILSKMYFRIGTFLSIPALSPTEQSSVMRGSRTKPSTGYFHARLFSPFWGCRRVYVAYAGMGHWCILLVTLASVGTDGTALVASPFLGVFEYGKEGEEGGLRKWPLVEDRAESV
ncbi:hypothetical protein B9Z19DRAFT_1067683 [Tuber borchii]|uniref:Uncharacterized protein n=1 Tax=Tuber borchii TaxID=42251 RepID=A0A2T6ZI16_TUBBO|nr:hypothetical protein B9Z19DRAFT_1067683 [Tuber borchii]